MSPESLCMYLNKQLVEQPGLTTSMLRTSWQLDPEYVPDDMEVVSTSSGCCHVDIVGFLNGFIAPSGYRLKAVNINNVTQFITEKIHEEMSPSE